MSSEILNLAYRLAEQGERDPVRAVQNAEKIRGLLQRAKHESEPAPSRDGDRLAHVLDRLERVLTAAAQPLAALGVTHIVRVDDAPALAAGQTSPALKIDWPGGDGIARSMFAGTLDGDVASLSRVSVRIAINGSDDLFTTGHAPAYMPIIAFQASNHNWFRLRDYAVSPAQKWTIYFQHEGPASSSPITPFLLFGFVKGH